MGRAMTQWGKCLLTLANWRKLRSNRGMAQRTRRKLKVCLFLATLKVLATTLMLRTAMVVIMHPESSQLNSTSHFFTHPNKRLFAKIEVGVACTRRFLSLFN